MGLQRAFLFHDSEKGTFTLGSCCLRTRNNRWVSAVLKERENSKPGGSLELVLTIESSLENPGISTYESNISIHQTNSNILIQTKVIF